MTIGEKGKSTYRWAHYRILMNVVISVPVMCRYTCICCMRKCRNRKCEVCTLHLVCTCFSHSGASPLHAGEVSKPQRVSEAPILAAVASVWDGAFCSGVRECVTWLYCVLWSLVVVLYPGGRSNVFKLLIWRNREHFCDFDRSCLRNCTGDHDWLIID